MWPFILLWGCLLFPGCGAMVGPNEISGFEGDTVSLQCTYSEELRTYRKYWCKEGGYLISRCSNTVYAGEDGQEKTEGRVSLQDSPQELTLKVTLRELTLQDTGQYFCGVSKVGRDVSFQVSLLVSPGTSRPSTQPGPTTAGDTRLAPGSSGGGGGGSMSRVSIPMVRILAPVLVLLSLLLVAGLVALGSYQLRWRKEAQLASETQRNEKVHLSHLSLEYAVINPAAAPGPGASPEPSSAKPYTEIQGLSQTSEEEEASSRDYEGDMIPGPPLHASGEELSYSKFISV